MVRRMQREKNKKTIKIERTYKHRVPHKPTRVFKDRKKYTRKGKVKDRFRRAISSEDINE